MNSNNSVTNQPDKVMSERSESNDWTISELYNKSWEIVKKYKILWIFGMAVGATSGGSNFSNFSRLGNIGTQTGKPAPTPAPHQTLLPNLNSFLQDVLGASTSTSWTQAFSHIPIYLWFVLGTEILLVFLLFWTISIIYSAWASGGLINAIDIALIGKSPTIGDVSEKSFKSIKSLAWLFIVPGLILGLGGLGAFGVLGLLATVVHGIALVPLFILMSISLLIFLYLWAYLSLSQIWALRLVVLDGRSGKEALFAGYRIARKKKWAMVGLGVVNTIAGTMVVLAPIAIIITLVFLALFARALIAVAVIAAIPVFVAILILGGIITAFKASTWTIAYKRIRNKYAS